MRSIAASSSSTGVTSPLATSAAWSTASIQRVSSASELIVAVCTTRRYRRRTVHAARTASVHAPDRPPADRATARVVTFLLAATASTVAMTLQAAALGKQIYDITDSELALGLLGLVEFLPGARPPAADRLGGRPLRPPPGRRHRASASRC